MSRPNKSRIKKLCNKVFNIIKRFTKIFHSYIQRFYTILDEWKWSWIFNVLAFAITGIYLVPMLERLDFISTDISDKIESAYWTTLFFYVLQKLLDKGDK